MPPEKSSPFGKPEIQAILEEPEVQEELTYHRRKMKPTSKKRSKSDLVRAQVAEYRTTVPPRRSLNEIAESCCVTPALVRQVENGLLSELLIHRSIRRLKEQ